MVRDRHKGSDRFRALVGKPGVVYVLGNDGLRHGWLKIGCSTRSGQARAFDLNNDANTGTPGVFRCIYQFRTLDCGTAEQEVFARLRRHRRGKWGQEFFEVDLALAKSTIETVCSEVDRRQPLAAPNGPLSLDPRHTATNTGDVAEPPLASWPPSSLSTGFAKRSRPLRLRWALGASIVAVLVLLMFGPGVKTPPLIDGKQVSSQSPKSAKSLTGERPNEPVQVKSAVAAKRDLPQVSTTGVSAQGNAAMATGAKTSNAIGSSSATNELAGTPVDPSSFPSEQGMKARDANLPGSNRVESMPVDSTCSSERYMQDPVAYSRCLTNQRP